MFKTIFKVNDVVEAFGQRGKVVYIETVNLSLYPVQVQFDVMDHEIDKYMWFTLDGKVMKWVTSPQLELISRPNEEFKVTLEELQKVFESEETHSITFTNLTNKLRALNGTR
jgi:hypothetical protein